MASIYKRGRVWWATWTEYVRGKSVRRRKSLKTERKDVAQRLLGQIVHDLAIGQGGPITPPLSRRAFTDTWEERIRANARSERAALEDIRRLRAFLDFLDGEHRLVEPSDITAADIVRYRDARLDTVSKGTVRRDLDVILGVLRKAHALGEIAADPTQGVAKPVPARRHIVYLTPAQTQRVIDAAREWRDGEAFPAVAVAAYCGLRQAELLHLEWDDLDFAARRLHVCAKDDWVPKDNEERLVPIHRAIADELERYPRRCRWVIPDRLGHQRPTRAYMRGVFEGSHNKRLEQRIGGLRELSGVRRAGWQVLRHTFASTLVSAGVSIFKVSRWLGHSSVQVTERHYAHLAPGDHHEDMDRISYGS